MIGDNILSILMVISTNLEQNIRVAGIVDTDHILHVATKRIERGSNAQEDAMDYMLLDSQAT